MADKQMLLYTLTIRTSDRNGPAIGLLEAVKCIAAILDKSTEFIYKLKVTGEPVIRAVAMVGAGSLVEQYLSEISLVKGVHVEVTCSPLIEFHKWGKLTGISEELNQRSPYNITDRHFYWIDLDVGYQGKTQAELFDILRREGTIALQLRTEKNVQLDLLKVLYERKFHLLVSIPGDDLQAMFVNLPLFVENGHNIHIVTKSVQQLHAYVSNNGAL